MPKKELPRKIIRQEMLWPTPYWHTIIWEFMRSKTKVSFNEDMTGWILGKMEREKSVIKSNRGGWQSELQNPKGELLPLVKEIAEFCKHLPLDIKEIRVPQLWINVNKKGDWNTIHQHGQYHLSGTYYIKVPKDSGKLVFRDPRPGAIGNAFINYSFDKGEFNTVNIMEGLLMIWPPYLDHFVQPSQTDEERISVSFDIMCR
tara:strand:+ start:31 stop:636 length:606 start_codon:yes stop_codon:yes gene_type:complete